MSDTANLPKTENTWENNLFIVLEKRTHSRYSSSSGCTGQLSGCLMAPLLLNTPLSH